MVKFNGNKNSGSGTGGMAPAIECLPSQREDMSSNLNTAPKNKEKRKKKKRNYYGSVIDF
jgi:hypothetical protein